MKYDYKPLIGLCKDCLYKCGRVEKPDFIGIYRCKYYLKENNSKNEEFNDRKIN